MIKKDIRKEYKKNINKTRAQQTEEMEQLLKNKKRGITTALFAIKTINYFLAATLPLTASLNFLPAEKAGTVLAAILISLPV